MRIFVALLCLTFVVEAAPPPPKQYQSQFTTNPPGAILTAQTVWSNLSTYPYGISVNTGMVRQLDPISGPFNAASQSGVIPNTDVTLTLQAAIDNAGPNNAIMIPAGRWKLSGPLRITNSNVELFGVGEQKTILQVTSGTNAICIGGTTRVFNINLHGFQITASPGVLPDGIGLHNASEVVVSHVAINQCGNAIVVDGVEKFESMFNTLSQNRVGYWLTKRTAGAFGFSNLSDLGSTMYQNTNACIFADGPINYLTMVKTRFEATHHVFMGTNSVAGGVEMDNINFINCLHQVIAGTEFSGTSDFVNLNSGPGPFFIINGFHVLQHKGIANACTNYFSLTQGTGTTVGYNAFTLQDSEVFEMGANSYIFFSDFPISATWVNNQIQAPAVSGNNTGYLDGGQVGIIKMVDTNSTMQTMLSRTTGNDLQLTSGATNAGLGLFTGDSTKNIYFDVGADGNKFVIDHGFLQSFVPFFTSANIVDSANLSIGTAYTGNRLNLEVNDFIVWHNSDTNFANNPVALRGTTNELAFTVGGLTRYSILSNAVFQANGPMTLQSTSGQDISLFPASGVNRIAGTMTANTVNSTNTYQINGSAAVASAIYTNLISGVITQRIVITGGLVTSITTL